MIKSLKLSYFRQHIDRTFEFGPGINAIRGPNEGGKTTILEAFAYLCFGARALKETLDDVVTYEQPVSKLRVDGVITLMGVTYTAYRAKSGAEVTFGTKERITGQNEVTAFFEKLFGVDAKMAGKLMISSQKSIAESITAGPADAGKLIEDLANFSLIEDLAQLVQTKLPTGVTTAIEGRIAGLREQVAGVDAEEEDLEPLRASVTEAETDLARTASIQAKLQEERSNLLVDLAKQILADEKAHQATVETTTYELSQIDAALAVEAPVAPTPAQLAAARAEVEAEKGWARAAGIHKELVAAKIEDQWDKDLASLEAEIADTQDKCKERVRRRDEAAGVIATADKELAELRRTSGIARATLEGKLIKESTCAFCDKDLTDVPEVVTRNSFLSDELGKLQRNTDTVELSLGEGRATQVELRDKAAKELAESLTYLADLQAVVKANDKAEQLYAKAGDLVTVDRSTVPGLWTWAGVALEGDRADVKTALAKLEASERVSVAFEATRIAQVKQRNALLVKRDAAILARTSLQIGDANETLGMAAELDEKLVDANKAVTGAASALATAQSTLATKEALAAQAARAAEQVKAQLKAAEDELAEMVTNNALVKKIRSARPVITNKLWSIVLAGSSDHLTQVRETPSSITRDEKMFRVNGRPAAGLSGSGEDMLGLAVRISLTRTFLASLGFLVLDEPGAACSDARESTMLGMLSTLGFEQILLITHSDLCDAYADNMIII